MMTFPELENSILVWARQRNLLNPDKSSTKLQLLKTVSELGELSDALLKGNHSAIADGIGDILVTLIIFAHLCGLHPLDCLELAYKEIKDRKGCTVNGVFIKA